MKYTIALIAGTAIVGLIVTLGGIAVHNAKVAAVSKERRERTADAIELIRTTDKALGVKRKATDADLCRALGGEPGECE